MKVFFYGLFMDEGLLERKGMKPSNVSLGFVDGYRLRKDYAISLLAVASQLGFPDSYLDQIRRASVEGGASNG